MSRKCGVYSNRHAAHRRGCIALAMQPLAVSSAQSHAIDFFWITYRKHTLSERSPKRFHPAEAMGNIQNCRDPPPKVNERHV